jgi:hypothetical protein
MILFFGNVIAPSTGRPAKLDYPESRVCGLPCEGSGSRFSSNFSADFAEMTGIASSSFYRGMTLMKAQRLSKADGRCLFARFRLARPLTVIDGTESEADDSSRTEASCGKRLAVIS